LLYKPENFDNNRKYPMIVYFYEKNSDNLNSHWIPSPSRSIINPALYCSNGYVVFIPDIKYELGHPGKSALNCISSGTDYIISLGFVDKNKIGIQGQSWGGYQVAYLVTQTDKYKCAMAGAAVSDMVSAYGGIRWESGMSRMFQYEEEQSRIGATLWEKPELYIENSPVFFADKVQTPLLMMNNDNDGAVPWYQGIEFFTALRRLNKPVWMLVYNGDAHNLEKWPNRIDLSIRMMQFFNHYLKDEPAPDWMINGVKAIDKDKKWGNLLLK
jgi:dipeptidyl aminopeptidase/acylaminoacyl peptidase